MPKNVHDNRERLQLTNILPSPTLGQSPDSTPAHNPRPCRAEPVAAFKTRGFNLAVPPTAARAFGTNDRWMSEAATSPHLRSMTIATSELIPWPIIVHASSINPSVVTVGDVLTAVHNALYTLLTQYKYQSMLLPNVPVTRALENRYWNGMRRLDLVNDRHWWAGLSKSQEGPEIWDLHLRR